MHLAYAPLSTYVHILKKDGCVSPSSLHLFHFITPARWLYFHFHR